MKNDDRIKELMKLVENKKASLGDKPKTAWRTNGIFKIEGKNHINLNTVRKVEDLVDALSCILSHQLARREAEKCLCVQASAFQHDGYSLEEWVEDFKLRISQIEWDDKKVTLMGLEKQLQELISEDAKTEMALDEVAKALGMK